MITIDTLKSKLKSFLLSQLDVASNTAPALKLAKPILSRVIDNNIDKAIEPMNLVADINGNIDADGILSEMINTVSGSSPFNIKLPVVGDVVIGEGKIKFNVPFTGNQLIFNTSDLENLKELLNN